MVGAMVVLVVLLVASGRFRSLVNRTSPTDAVRTVGLRAGGGAGPQGGEVRPGRARRRCRRAGGPPSVTFRDPSHRWHLGMLTDEDRYVGLEQADDSVATMVETYVDQARERGRPVQVDGRPWPTYTDAGGDLALVRRGRRRDHARGRARRAEGDAGRPTPPACLAGSPRRRRQPSVLAIAASSRLRAPSSQLLADLGELLAALPERQRLLEGGAAGLEPAHHLDELLAGLLVARAVSSWRRPHRRSPAGRSGCRARCRSP